MSWQWIPAQLEIKGVPYSNQDSSQYWWGYKPGYYIGQGRDEGKYLVNSYGYSGFGYNPTDRNAWIIVSDICPRFVATAYTSSDTSSDTSADTFYFYWGSADRGGETRARNTQQQEVFFGKPVYAANAYYLQYSPSDGRYIIVEKGGALSEPIYSTNVLSGGISGDHYWRTGGAVTDLQLDTPPMTFNLTGATDEYTQTEDYIDHFVVCADMDFYTLQSETSADDERPAGLYRNKDGDEIEVGIKTYKGDDDSLWKGYRLSSFSPYYESYEHGRLAWTLSTDQWGDCWMTPNGSKESKYVFANGVSSLPDHFTLNYFEWDEGTSAYVEVTSASIEMDKGPYQLLSSPSPILMGEFSQWR